MRAWPLLFVCIVQADDWPQWRGLNRDGHWNETGIVETLGAESLAVAWRTPVGFGFASPVVAQGRVFATDSQLERPKARERVLCFDETSGQALWSHSYDVILPEWAFDAGQEQGPDATPVVHEEKVFTLGCRGDLFCLDARHGKVLWHKDLASQFPAAPLATRSSPLIDGELLILVIGGKPDACVIALEQATGREAWRALGESAGHSSPIIIFAGGRRQLIVWTQQSVSALDPATGDCYWREALSISGDSVVSTPVFSKDRLLVGGVMFKLDAEKPMGSVLWPERRLPSRSVLSNTSTALLYGDHVFSARSSGSFVCLEADTGRQLWETDKVTTPGNGSSIHPTLNGNSVLLFNDTGVLIRARLTPHGYAEIGRVLLIEPTYRFGARKVAWAPPLMRMVTCSFATTENSSAPPSPRPANIDAEGRHSRHSRI